MSKSNPSIKIAGKTAKNRSKKTLSEKTVARINRGIDVFGLNRPKPANTTKKELPNKQTVESILKAVKDALTKPSKVASTVQANGNVVVDTGVEIRIENSITGGFNFQIKRQTHIIPGNRKSPLEKFLEKPSPIVGHNTAFDLASILGKPCGGRALSTYAPFPFSFVPQAMPIHRDDAAFDAHLERLRKEGGVDFETPPDSAKAPAEGSTLDYLIPAFHPQAPAAPVRRKKKA